jgi:hypothetical protein
MNAKHTIDCPICKGLGKMPRPHQTTKPDRARKAAMCKAMAKAGYSYREMAAFLGYKSKRSISVLLGKPQSSRP